MKIELEPPFLGVWKSGCTSVNASGRTSMILFDHKGGRKNITYARYLMSVKLGRFLEPGEHVCHVDRDIKNCALDNLVIMSPQENAGRKKGETMKDFVCPVCGKEFQLAARHSHRVNPACSRQCGRRKGLAKQRARKLMAMRMGK